MATFGIDLGNKTSKVCIYENEITNLIPNQYGRVLTPSVVHITQDGYILVGEPAVDKLVTDPCNTISNFKCFLGTDHEFILQNKNYKAFELFGLILNQLKADVKKLLNEVIDTACFTIPVHFSFQERIDLNKAANLAGIQVSYFINDPCASSVTFIDTDVSKNKFLVIDFGGSFNASVIDFYRQLIEVVSNSYDVTINGDSLDLAISNYFFEQTEIDIDLLDYDDLIFLNKQFDLVKKRINYTITFENKVVEFDKMLLSEIFEDIFFTAKSTISRALELASTSPYNIKDIILLGGVSNCSLFCEYIEALFNKTPSTYNDAQSFMVKGATLHNAFLTDNIIDINLTDLCSYNFGISTKNINSKNDIMNILIAKHMPLPIMRYKRFHTVKDFQDKITCTICCGDNYYTKDNTILDIIEIPVPVKNATESFIDLNMFYHVDGILEVQIVTCDDKIYRKTIFNKSNIDNDNNYELLLVDEVKKFELNERIESFTQRLNILYSKSELIKKVQIGELFSIVEGILSSNRINEINRKLISLEDNIKFWENIIIYNQIDMFDIQNDLFLDEGMYLNGFENNFMSSDLFDELNEFDEFDEFDDWDDDWDNFENFDLF